MVIDTYLAQMRAPTDLSATPIPETDIARMLEGARWTPSADNEQAWRFLVITSPAKKEAVLQAVEQQDSRMQGAQAGELKTLTGADRDKMSFTFTQANYDGTSDPYRQSVEDAHPADVDCARNASILIVCTYFRKFMSKFYGGLEIGGAILHILLLAQKSGYAVRWIRNFNRETIRTSFLIPDDLDITAILAIGEPVSGEEIFTMEDDEEQSARGISLEDLILDRRSVRAYKEDPIPRDIIDSLLNVNKIVPTFGTEKFIEVIPAVEPDLLQKVANEARIVFIKQKHVGIAPAVFAVAYNASGTAGFYGKADVGMAIESILLDAYALGIGTCWIGAFSHGRMRRVLEVPDTHRMESLIAMGYPAEYPEPPPRLPLGLMAFRDEWKTPFLPVARGGIHRAGMSSIFLRNFKSADATSILRDRPAGTPWVPGFREINEHK